MRLDVVAVAMVAVSGVAVVVMRMRGMGVRAVAVVLGLDVVAHRGIVAMRRVPARRTLEGHEVEPPRVEGCQSGGQHQEHEGVDVAHRVRRVGRFDDRILREIAGRQREAGQRQRADGHHGRRERDLLAQAAHVADVLLVVHRVDDGARAQEQQRLEEGVGEQVENARREHAGAERHEHVAEL